MRKNRKPQRLDLRNGPRSHVKKRSAVSMVRDPFKGLAAMQRKKKITWGQLKKGESIMSPILEPDGLIIRFGPRLVQQK